MLDGGDLLGCRAIEEQAQLMAGVWAVVVLDALRPASAVGDGRLADSEEIGT